MVKFILRNSTVPELICRAFIPVIVLELVLSPFWFAHEYMDRTAWVSVAQILVTVLILPAYLAVVGIRFVRHSKVGSTLAAFGVLFGAVLMANFLLYAVWGVSTGMFWKPDKGTLDLLTISVRLGLGIALVPAPLATLFRYAFHYRRRV